MIGTIVSFFASASIGTIIGGLLMIAMIVVVGCFATTFITLLSTNIASWLVNWITIPGAGTMILWGQAIAIVVVIVIRIAVGINNGILKDEIKAPEYLFKSVGSIVLIGLMPIAIDLTLAFAHSAMSDVLGWNTLASSFSTDSGDFLTTIENNIKAMSSDGLLVNLLNLLLTNIAILVIALIMTSTVFQLFVRQAEMVILSIAAPWVGIKTATEHSSSDYWEFLQNMIGMGVVQVIQYFALIVCFKNFGDWYSGGPGTFIGSATFLSSNVENINGSWQKFFLLMALVVVTANIGNLLSRWLFSGGSVSSMTRIAPMIMNRMSGNKLGSKAETVSNKLLQGKK